MNSTESTECPLCMEVMDFDDVDFFPCPCRYQICRFCWYKIINEENGLCPACRKPYNSEHPASYKPRTDEEIKNRIRHSKKICPKKNKPNTDGKEYLSEYRVLQKNLIFVVGLPMRMAEEIELLKGSDYFGKCGKVYKIVINQNQTFPGPQGTSCLSAYVTYHRNEDALRTLIDLKKLEIDGRAVKLSLGTTKYCSQFLRNRKCNKIDCMYLHEMGDQAASFTKEDMASGRHTEYENQLIQEFIESSQKPTISGSISSVSNNNNNNNIVISSHSSINTSGNLIPVSSISSASIITNSTIGTSASFTPSDRNVTGTSPNNTNINKLNQRAILTPIGTDPNDATKLYNSLCSGDNNNSNNNNNSHKLESVNLTQTSSPGDNDSIYHLHNHQQQHHNYQQQQQFAAISQQTNNSHHYPLSNTSPTNVNSNAFNSCTTDNAADIDFDPISISRQGLAELIANESRLQMTEQPLYLSNSGVLLQSSNNQNNANVNNSNRLRSNDYLVQQMNSFNLSNNNNSNGHVINSNTNSSSSNGNNVSAGVVSTNNTPPPGFEFAATVGGSNGGGNNISSSTSPISSSTTPISANESVNNQEFMSTMMNTDFYNRFGHHNQHHLSHHSHPSHVSTMLPHNNQITHQHSSNTQQSLPSDIPYSNHHLTQQHSHHPNHMSSLSHHQPPQHFQMHHQSSLSHHPQHFQQQMHHQHHPQHHHQHHHHQSLNFHNSYPDYSNTGYNTNDINSQSFHATSAVSSSWKNVHSSFCDPNLSSGNTNAATANTPTDLISPATAVALGIRPSVYNRSHSMNEGSATMRNSDWNGFPSFTNPNSNNNNNNNNNSNNTTVSASSTIPTTITDSTSTSAVSHLSNCLN